MTHSVIGSERRRRAERTGEWPRADLAVTAGSGQIAAFAAMRLAASAALRQDDLVALTACAGPIQALARGAAIWREDEPATDCVLLLGGWAASSVSLADGSRRLLRIHMPGDVLGLPNLVRARAPVTVVTLSDATLYRVPVATMRGMLRSNPRIAEFFFGIAQEENLLMLDQLAAMGRASARMRVANMLIQIHARAADQNSAAGSSFHLPLTQLDVADLVGLTPVHVNRTIQQLRRDRLVEWRRTAVTVLDWYGLRKLAALSLRPMAGRPAGSVPQ